MSNWVNVGNIASFLEGKKKLLQTAQIPSVEGKLGCPPVHFLSEIVFRVLDRRVTLLGNEVRSLLCTYIY